MNIYFFNFYKKLLFTNKLCKSKIELNILEITYNIIEQSHSGYCSDPHSEEEFEDNIIIYYHVP